MPKKAERAQGVIVLDIASDFIKAGWAGEDAPRCSIPAVLVKDGGQERKRKERNDEATTSYLVGREALEYLRGLHMRGESTEKLEIIYPVHKGRIVDWNAMMYLVERIFSKKLKIGSGSQTSYTIGYTVLVTDTPGSSEEYRLKLVKALFKFKMPGICLVSRGTMAIFDSGKSTGISLVTAGDVAHAVPVYKGFALPHATISTDVAGDYITKVLKICLSDFGIKEAVDSMWEPIMKDIKDQSCFVVGRRRQEALLNDFVPFQKANQQRKEELETLLEPERLEKKIDEKIQKDEKIDALITYEDNSLKKLGRSIREIYKKRGEEKKSLSEEYLDELEAEKKRLQIETKMLYNLPRKGGEIVPIDDMCRFVCPEVLFAPKYILGHHSEQLGLQDMVFRSIKMCDPFLQKILKQNIVLAGHVTEMAGFTMRVTEELQHLCASFDAEDADAINVVSHLRRKDAVW
eukprot:CAMPEP_0197526526 /NCGR_PEP_ID=MMETSP1318-20131121/18052_1 /TAXON_ID=552666 /ORGANISM="Partenskyella glossopodia, Strain RCC365" /LENGTH=460 /DNA_ID=CAMNT_0043080711 /DNA_START=89 /DNA_END=1468 /DNA_ORIENTATION=+